MSVAILAATITTTCDAAFAARQDKGHQTMSKASDLTLTCHAALKPTALEIRYSVHNGGDRPVYVLDMLPINGAGTPEAAGNPAMNTVIAGPDHLTVLRGIAPLPRQPVAVRVIPLATALAPARALERDIVLNLPVAERSPYYGDLPLRQYTHGGVNAVTLVVHVVRETVDGFKATPANGFAEGLLTLHATDLVRAVESLSCTVPVRGLSILRRTDAFKRDL